MKISKLFGNLKPLAITYISVIAFSNFVFVLFSQTVRDIIWSFFKDAGGIVILGMVFLFALTWLLKARPHKIPKQYQVIVFDIGEKAGIKIKGPIPLPVKRLNVVTRKSPCGSGTETYEKWEMKMHRRIIDISADDKAMRQLMRLKIPDNVYIELSLT